MVVTLLDPSSTLEVSQEDGEGHLGHKESSRLAQVTQQPHYPGWLLLSTSPATWEEGLGGGLPGSDWLVLVIDGCPRPSPLCVALFPGQWHEPEVSLLTSLHGLRLNSCRGSHDGLWLA